MIAVFMVLHREQQASNQQSGAVHAERTDGERGRKMRERERENTVRGVQTDR